MALAGVTAGVLGGVAKFGGAARTTVLAEEGGFGTGLRGLGNQLKFESQSLAKTAQRAIAAEKELLKGEISGLKSSINKFLSDETGAVTFGKPKYNTKSLDTDYISEEHGKVFATKVKYLNDVERADLELFVENGKLVDTKGNLFDTSGATSLYTPSGGKAIFVMDENGRIFANLYQQYGKFHHSSMVAGEPVASAGELAVKSGEILEISRKSGHYQPDELLNKQIIKELQRRGMDTSKIKET